MNKPAARPALTPLDEALTRLLARATPVLRTERVSTFEADGRVLAQVLVSALTVPPHDNSAMDGYAVRLADCGVAGALLQVDQRIPAGSVGKPLAAGSAARIFTGAPIPPNADAVVMQEDASAQPADGTFGSVRIDIVPGLGQWIRRAGEDVATGDVVLAKGVRLTPAAGEVKLGVAMAVLGGPFFFALLLSLRRRIA